LNIEFENNFFVLFIETPPPKKMKILLCFIHITSFQIELRILGPLNLGTFASTYLEEFGSVGNIAWRIGMQILESQAPL